MNLEEFLRTCYDPVLIGFYHAGSETSVEKIEINTQNFDKRIKEIKKKYPGSFIDGFWSDAGKIIAHATI